MLIVTTPKCFRRSLSTKAAATKTATDRDAEAIEATQIKLANQKRAAQPGRKSGSRIVRVREGRGRECCPNAEYAGGRARPERPRRPAG